jgi:hypothetical protein
MIHKQINHFMGQISGLLMVINYFNVNIAIFISIFLMFTLQHQKKKLIGFSQKALKDNCLQNSLPLDALVIPNNTRNIKVLSTLISSLLH